MKIKFATEKPIEDSTRIPDGLEEHIDQIVRVDFPNIRPITEQDRENLAFQDLMRLLEPHNPQLCYARVVYSELAPIIPRTQYLLGFKPLQGLCLFAEKEQHKNVLCAGEIEKMAQKCLLVHSLQFLLLEPVDFHVWGYIPPRCNAYCPVDIEDGFLRRLLFE